MNARLGWLVSDDLTIYSVGYRAAAQRLFDTLQKTDVEVMVFPMVFLWRHHIELTLKDIILHGNRLRSDRSLPPNHHKLLVLWKLAIREVRRCNPASARAISNVEWNVRELARIDPGSFSFRYPRTKDGSASIPDDLNCINLKQFHGAMEAVANLLTKVMMRLIGEQNEMLVRMADADDE